MENLLEKLDRTLGRWINSMDEHLQEPLVHTMTGEVFTHGASSNHHNGSEVVVQKAAQPTAEPRATREPRNAECDPVCSPVLRGADAS